jgi:hypothetical protein
VEPALGFLADALHQRRELGMRHRQLDLAAAPVLIPADVFQQPEVVGKLSRQLFSGRNVVLALHQGEDIAQANQVSAYRLVDRLPLVAGELYR